MSKIAKKASERQAKKSGGERKKKHDKPQLNSDGVSVKGCSVIYAPADQAGEYAANPYRGCGHGCAYCYVPRIPGQPDRKTFNSKVDFQSWTISERWKPTQSNIRAAGINEQVMLSFTTDVYNPLNSSLTRPAIEILIEYGLGFSRLDQRRLARSC